jgi:hypothetical protein
MCYQRITEETVNNANNSRAATVHPGLAEALRQGEASSRAEGVDPTTSPAYVEVKRQLLAGEITMHDAHNIIEQLYDANASSR